MPLKKIAIFVEGQTESIFVKNLLYEIFGNEGLDITDTEIRGRIITARIFQIETDYECHILIVSCTGDNAVKQRIRDNFQSLKKAGYVGIIGLYDLYPHRITDLSIVKEKRYIGIEQNDIPIRLALAVMEIEAWFLCDRKHYSVLHPGLTIDNIRLATGFDVTSNNPEQVPRPARLLNEIYSLCGLQYKKRKWEVQRTVYALEYADIYLTYRYSIPHLNEFLNYLEEFLP